MTHVALTFTVPDDPAVEFSAGDAGDGPRFSGLAVPFAVASGPSQDGHRYRFSTPPANADELVDVVREHDPEAVLGRLAGPWQVTRAGLAAVARVFDTTAGRDAVTEAAEGVRRGFSVGAIITAFTEAADGVRDVTAWTAAHLGVVRRPAFTGAGFEVALSAAPPPAPPAPPTRTAERNTMDPENQLPTVAELAAQVRSELTIPTVAELAAQVREVLKVSDEQHPLAAFSSFRHYLAEFAGADETRRAALSTAFAIPDQITADNPGVVVPGWRTAIVANLDARRPAILATGGALPLPDGGMDANWPYFDGDLDAIIAQQATQKTELSGVKISLKKGTAPIKTAGTISDIAYQLLMRSTPSYLEAHMRICFAAWARYTEAKFELSLAGGTNAGAAIDTTDADAFRAQLFAGSVAVEDATGRPADVALVDTATFLTLGGLPGLHNGKYGTQNAAGTSSAATLEIDVNGLKIQRGKFLPAATMVLTNGDAARFVESGPQVATEEDVAKLGRNVAVWGMYEDAEVYFPAGVQVYKPQA